ncbi:MAG: phosphatidylserine/phosphatidylglycerophosphate/cardiolipin synthase family protein [Paludibaculum sp.]
MPAYRRICEAVEGAGVSVWLTVTFLWPTFEMPDGRGSAFDVLDRAAARGLDVRLICWRPDEETAALRPNAFWGSPEQIEQLNQRRSGVKIRWDRAHPGFCQHQKCWLIDAGADHETAFVGGMNLNPHSMVTPGHPGEGHNHDVFVEVAGPSTVDVQHNFVQRWNEASDRLLPDGCWGAGSTASLPFPSRLPAERGSAIVQIQRTTHAGRYLDCRAAPGGLPFEISAGEQTNFQQYFAAIDAARRSIYIENQCVDVPRIVDCLRRALQRGVEVVVLMPAQPGARSRVPGEQRAVLHAKATLGAYPNFLLAGIAGINAEGRRASVHVHAKLMLVDDEWATVGSCNLHRFSLFGNGEINAAFSEPDTVRAFRCELLREHLDQDTSGLDDRAALQLFRTIARANRVRFEAGDPAWQGLAFELGIE